MKRPGILKKAAILRGLYAALCSSMLLFGVETAAQGQSLLTHHVRQDVASGKAQFLNRMSKTQTLRLDVVLPLRDQAGLDKFLQDVYDPASPNYRHFLTVQEFTARFGPTEDDYDAVVQYATSNGLKLVGGSRDGMEAQLEGPVSSIEATFHVSMGVYRHPTQNRTFYAPDREPSVDLPIQLWHVSGLDNYSIPHPLYHSINSTVKKKPTSKPAATTGSGPYASYLGSDMRAAYYGGTALTGSGQNIGLLEYYGFDIADLNTYYSIAGQTRKAAVTGISTDGTSLSCLAPRTGNYCDDTEQIIDMTQALGMAPGITTLYVYVGATDTALLSSMTTHTPLPLQLSSSWTWTPADPKTDNPYFQKMAAQGQSFFQASGDSEAWSTSNDLYPSEDPYVICVGGTSLTTTGPGGAWKSEVGWVDGGGGISPDKYAIPLWQDVPGVLTSSNQGSTVYRNGPDVSANADFTFLVCADQSECSANEYGGTSFAAPMWAGYVALANQQAAANSGSPVGFINPTIYPIGLSSSYDTYFHDITSGNNGFPATIGYDLDSGWGSPNGAALIGALLGVPTGPNFSLSATSVSVAQGSSGGSTITSTIVNGFASAISLGASGQPSGVTVGFSPTSITGAGTSTLTLTVGSSVATGPYTITVTGTSGSITQTTTLTLTVTVPPNFSLGATSVSVAQGNSGGSTITSTVVGGFASAISLGASGQPSGVTVGFSPTSITGAGTSTLTFTVGSSVATGPYTITVTGTSGSLTHTTTLTLTVTVPPNFSLGATSVSVAQGNSGGSTVTSTVVGGFNSAISLGASGQPTGVTAGFSPTSITGAGTSTLTLTVASTVAAGPYTITVTGISGSITHTTTLTLTVTVPPFSLSSTPVSVVQGSSGGSTITSSVVGSFNSAISLAASGQPSGVTVGFSPTSITGAGTSTLTLTVGLSVAPGPYTITVTGTSGSVTQTTTFTLTVTAAPSNFTISPSVSAITVDEGSYGSATITTAAVGTFNSAIALSATGQPSFVRVILSPASIAAPGSGSSTIYFILNGYGVQTGTYPITITGTGGGITKTTTISLTVAL